MQAATNSTMFSLIWPGGSRQSDNLWPGITNPYLVDDLNLTELAEALSFDRFHLLTAAQLLRMISVDPEVINYRLDVIEDLLANPELSAALEAILPLLDDLEANLINTPMSMNDYPFLQTVNRLGELEVYVDCISPTFD